MSTRRRAPKARIPGHKVLTAKIRKFAKKATADLKQTLKRTAKPSRSRSSRSTKSGTREFRPNPWKKCPECFHRVPKMCRECGRGRAGVVDTHVQACCPGPCGHEGAGDRCKDPTYGCPSKCKGVDCRKCEDRCDGPCEKCKKCRGCQCGKEDQ
jgi:hypothetical protein